MIWSQVKSRLLILIFLLIASVMVIAEEVPVVRFTVSGFIVDGENPLTQEQTDTILMPFLGEHVGLEGLHEAASALEVEIVKAGHSFHRVVLPPQTLEAGQVHLKVVAFTLANIEVNGNRFFSDKNVINTLPSLESGTVPNTRKLSRELVVANDHVAKEVTIRLKQSTVPDSIDAVLEVEDHKPWQVFAVLNNIGTSETGKARTAFGYQHSNVFDLDDTFTMSYTTSPNHTSDVKQWGFSNQLPVYALSGSLYFFYSRSDVNSGQVQQVFDVSGAGKFLGGSYTQTLFNINNYHHRLSVGIDDKLFENNISFQGIPIGIDVRSRPLTVTYLGDYLQERSNLKFRISYVRNLRGGNLNNSLTYALSRFGAEQDWEALRYGLSYRTALPKNWMLSFAWDGQYSGEPLISGEQFGLGGAYSVRGFEERAVSGDWGNRASLEVWTPPISFLKDVRLLGFIDAGHIKRLKTLTGEVSSDTLASMGLGLRWYWKNNLSVELDYAHEINAAKTSGAGGVKTHVNIVFRY